MLEQSQSKEEIWRLRVNDYLNSGLTVRSWCSQNNFPVSTFRYWLQMFNKKQPDNAGDSNQVFAQLPVMPATSFLETAPITIYMGTIRIEITDSCHPDLLNNLIGILSNHA